MGRAARNLHGRAILYADRITGSMQRALDETDRRRRKQRAYNEEHGITPRGVEKAVADIMEGAYNEGAVAPRHYAEVAEELIQYALMPPAKLAALIKKLEQQMLAHAKNLEFEEAAKLRDRIHHVREVNLGMTEKVAH
jgi:excinuclease ABC subunit B